MLLSAGWGTLFTTEYRTFVLEIINVLSPIILIDAKSRFTLNRRFPIPELFTIPSTVFHDTPESVVLYIMPSFPTAIALK